MPLVEIILAGFAARMSETLDVLKLGVVLAGARQPHSARQPCGARDDARRRPPA